MAIYVETVHFSNEMEHICLYLYLWFKHIILRYFVVFRTSVTQRHTKIVM